MLKSFIYLFRSYSVTDSEFSCLAKVAKSYCVYGPTYMPHVPNQLYCIQNCALEVPIGLDLCHFSR